MPSGQPSTSAPIGSGVSPVRDHVARVLMLLLSAASLAVFVQAALTFGTATPEQINARQWQMFGFVVFAGLYALLAIWPRRMPGLWELALFHKVAQIALISLLSSTAWPPEVAGELRMVVTVDSILVVVTATSYALTRGWRPWFDRAGR